LLKEKNPMPIRYTTTQTRPNTSVAWAYRSTLGYAPADWTTEPGYLDYSQEVSEDGLILTITLLFTDSWELKTRDDSTPEELAIVDSVQQYALDNGITFTYSTENI